MPKQSLVIQAAATWDHPLIDPRAVPTPKNFGKPFAVNISQYELRQQNGSKSR